MARTRYIKPGFFTNENLTEFSPWHRLLFAGLWIIADRAGRLEDRPKRIKAEVFPHDTIAPSDVDGWLADLAAGSEPFIVRYEVGGKSYIQIVKWSANQKPHKNETPSMIPPLARTTKKAEQVDEFAPKDGDSTTKAVPTSDLNVERELERGMENGDGEGHRADATAAPPESRRDFGQSILGAHRTHGWCNQRGLCVPRMLYDELLQRVGVDRQAELRAWMGSVIDGLGPTVPGETVWVFWRSRFEAWHGVSSAKAEPAARPELGSWRDECERVHGGHNGDYCGNQTMHRARMLNGQQVPA